MSFCVHVSILLTVSCSTRSHPTGLQMFWTCYIMTFICEFACKYWEIPLKNLKSLGNCVINVLWEIVEIGKFKWEIYDTILHGKLESWIFLSFVLTVFDGFLLNFVVLFFARQKVALDKESWVHLVLYRGLGIQSSMQAWGLGRRASKQWPFTIQFLWRKAIKGASSEELSSKDSSFSSFLVSCWAGRAGGFGGSILLSDKSFGDTILLLLVEPFICILIMWLWKISHMMLVYIHQLF